MPPPPPPPRRGTSTDDSSVYSGISDELMLQIASPPHTSRTHSTNTLSSHGDPNRGLSSVGTTESSNNETPVRDDEHSPVRSLFFDNNKKKKMVPTLSAASNVPMRKVQTATPRSEQPPNSQSTPASAQASGASQPSQGRQLVPRLSVASNVSMRKVHDVALSRPPLGVNQTSHGNTSTCALLAAVPPFQLGGDSHA